MSKPWTRRRVLAGASIAIGGIAGCLGGSDGGDGNETAMPDGDGSGGDSTGSSDGADDGSDGDSGADDDGTTGDDSAGGDGGNVSDDGDGNASEGGGSDDGELDLTEANVTAVEIEEVGDREFEFSVTLYHDDEGEDGYADWWAVETKDVEELGRRDLSHAHGTEEFTRSATIEIPEGVECVVVRGHDQTHEYGGQAMLVSIPGGATEAHQQGSDPSAFADVECP